MNRIKIKQTAYYHCVSRIVGREMLLGNTEKEHMHKLIRKIEGFTGVRVLTYALMTNHIHLLLEEPDRDTPVDTEEFHKRLASLYNEDELAAQYELWEKWNNDGCEHLVKEDQQRYLVRMHDISEFMKQLKQRFSRWYNRVNDRKGALWEARFKSVLVQPGTPLGIVAAYIELNPVRAQITKEPCEYTFCGFSEAIQGGISAQQGIQRICELKDPMQKWNSASSHYLKHILMYDETSKRSGQYYLDYETLREKIKTRVKLSDFERLLCRSRYFSDGLILGDKDFIERYFSEHRDCFGEKRMDGSRKVKGGWTDFFAIRELIDW